MKTLIIVLVSLAFVLVALAEPASAFHVVCVTEPCDDTPQDLLCTTKYVRQILILLGQCH